MICRNMRTLGLLIGLTLVPPPLGANSSSGKLLGIVMAEGIPQLGATVVITPEQARGFQPIRLLTNEQGLFHSKALLPGLYSVHVRLAGFLPIVEQHVRIEPRQTTLLKIELDSVFSSLERLRRGADPKNQKLDSDEWSWVLRTSSSTRPVLRWTDGEVVLDGEPSQTETAKKNRPHGRVELTSGARHPGSVSNLADSPATSFAYDQSLGRASRLLLAGHVSYEHSAAAGFATTWLPSGEAGKGPSTSLVLRQSKLGPEGPWFHGVRLAQDGQVALGDRAALRYGAEYVLVALGRSASSLAPRAELAIRLSPNWRASFTLASRPWPDADPTASSLQSASDQLDAFPTLLMRNGQPLLERDWHQELAVERLLSSKSSVVMAVFRDRAHHTAVFGRGELANPDYFQDFFSEAFAYDGGESDLRGSRLAYRQKFSNDLEAALVYAWAGALWPEEQAANLSLRDALHSQYRHSLAARLSARVQRWGTQLAASYQWLSGHAVTRPDAFGESLYRVDPYLNLSFRQPLPNLFCCRLEVLGDFRNLLAQGYVPVSTRDGQAVLIPSFRSFRGGFSVQF